MYRVHSGKESTSGWRENWLYIVIIQYYAFRSKFIHVWRVDLWAKKPKGRYTLGDKLQQHVAATDHSMWTGRATSCSNTVRRHIAATNRFVCTGEFLWKSLSPQRNFGAATSRKKSSQTESVRLVAATKFCCSDKNFPKNSPVHTQRFVAAKCRRDMLLQLVAQCEPTLTSLHPKSSKDYQQNMWRNGR